MSPLLGYLQQAGSVALPLVLMGLTLWYLLTLRWLALRPGLTPKALDAALEAMGRGEPPPTGDGVVVEALATAADGGRPQAVRASLELQARSLSRGQRVVRVLVAAAPLLGLLGTVTGMIETFASLGDMTLVSRTGGVAGGISVALVSTQLGLVVAIPGLLAGRLLDQRESRLRLVLLRIGEQVSVWAGEDPREGAA